MGHKNFWTHANSQTILREVFSTQISSEEMGQMILVGTIIFACVFIFIACAIHSRKVEIVEETSKLLKKLNSINEEFCFHQKIATQYTAKRNLPSKQKYDRYDCATLCDEVLLDETNPIHNDLKKVKENKDRYTQYICEINKQKSTITEEETKPLKISYETYCKIENSLFTKKQQKPIINGQLTCTVKYTSPAGRNHYSKSHTYSYSYLIQRFDELQEILRQRESEEFKRKMERSRMTPKLRIAVLERDGRRCQICGARQEDGATLHVDHIIPVAKGGKTEMSNLRTLCDMCNQGKSDQILENDLTNTMDKD